MKATKAMYALIKRARYLHLPIDIQIELFSKIIKPILTYGCKIWGFGKLAVIERVQLKFLKMILNVKNTTPDCMVYGETGVLPNSIDIYIYTNGNLLGKTEGNRWTQDNSASL